MTAPVLDSADLPEVRAKMMDDPSKLIGRFADESEVCRSDQIFHSLGHVGHFFGVQSDFVLATHRPGLGPIEGGRGQIGRQE
jgi:hypothetical protein